MIFAVLTAMKTSMFVVWVVTSRMPSKMKMEEICSSETLVSMNNFYFCETSKLASSRGGDRTSFLPGSERDTEDVA